MQLRHSLVFKCYEVVVNHEILFLNIQCPRYKYEWIALLYQDNILKPDPLEHTIIISFIVVAFTLTLQ